jgi:type 2 lantibiotic biosynthesis protein LanM
MTPTPERPTTNSTDHHSWSGVVLRSLSLEERLTLASEANPSGRLDAEVDEVLEAWARAFAPGDASAFARRLRWDGLDEDATRRALAQAPGPEALSAPWSLWLTRILVEADELYRRLDAGVGFPPGEDLLAREGFRFDGEEHPPFLEIALAAVKATRKSLGAPGAESRVTPGAWRRLEKQLLEEVAATGELALFERYRSFLSASDGAASSQDSGGRYRDFLREMLSSGLGPLFHELPVLARQIATILECWLDSTRELLDRLDEDRRALADLFGVSDIGRVMEIDPALSDPHQGRRRVARLRFDSGVVLLYKPRDMCIERDYNDLLRWLGEAGLEPPPPWLKVLARSGYGWVEQARNEEADDEDTVRRFFRASGALVCVSYVLNGRDFHMENVVATREGPVLIDPEMFFQPERGKASSSGSPKPDEEPGACLQTGMVSLIETGPDGAVYDIGGLRGGERVPSALRTRSWRNHGTDALGYVEVSQLERAIDNRIRFNGAPQNPSSFAREILSGFVAAYRFFLDRRGALETRLQGFSGTWVRVLLRPTSHYALASRMLREPKYQRSGIANSLLLEALHRGFANRPEPPPLWVAARHEKEALLRLDVPRFNTLAAGLDLPVAGNGVIEGYFCRSGLEVVMERLRGLGERDLALQADALREALESSVEDRFVSALPGDPEAPGEADARRHWLRYALWIGEELLYWRNRKRKQSEPALEAPPARKFHLYDGLVGEAVFYAALASVTGDARWREPAREISSLVGKALGEEATRAAFREDDLGACSGSASIIYGLGLVGRLARDESALQVSFGFAELLDEERIAAQEHMDVVSGCAGAVLVLWGLLQYRRDEPLLRLIDRCAVRLLEGATRTDAGLVWLDPFGRSLPGFGHGAAGIALALVRAFEATGERVFLGAAREAYALERRLYSPALGNWPIPGNGAEIREVVMTAWCNGAPGIALGRALAVETLHDDAIDGEIEAALRATTRAGLHPSDHLCCGNLGRSEVLLTVGHLLKRRDAVESAHELAEGVVRRAERRGHFPLKSSGFSYPIRSATFFRGLSGIGYQMLRLAEPSRIPSVLGFEPYRDPPALGKEQR